MQAVVMLDAYPPLKRVPVPEDRKPRNPYLDRTMDDLRDEARRRGLNVEAGIRKAELAAALFEHDHRLAGGDVDANPAPDHVVEATAEGDVVTPADRDERAFADVLELAELEQRGWHTRLDALAASGVPLNAILEPNYYGLWIGKQTAKGTPNTAPSKRLIQVGGDFTVTRDDGNENYSDLTKYGARTDWVNSLTGTGEPVIEATPEELAYLLWLFHGAETVTSVVGPPAGSKHSFTPALGRGHWCTAFVRVGQTLIRRHQYNDSLVTRIALEASSANKAVRATPRILSLDPAEVKTADPAANLPTDKPFLHTDAAVGNPAGATTDGSITIDGVVFRGVTQWAITIDDAWEPIYGDDARPFDFVQGTPGVTVGATVPVDSDGLAEFNKLVYGSASPAAGTKPLRNIPALGNMTALLRQRDSVGAFNGREFKGLVPGVKWAIPDAPGPNPDGGNVELALAGEMRPVSGQPAYTLDVTTASGVAAFTT